MKKNTQPALHGLSPTGIKKVEKRVDAFLARRHKDAVPLDRNEVLESFKRDRLNTHKHKHVHGIEKRIRTQAARRLAKVFGLSVPPELGSWQHSKSGYRLSKLPMKGYFQLVVPALMPAEVTGLMQALRQTTAAGFAREGEFCFDAREALGPHYKVDKIIIADAFVKRLRRQGRFEDLQPLVEPYLAIAAERMEKVTRIADRLNELCGYPAWKPDFKRTQECEHGAVALKFNLASSPNWCEAWTMKGSLFQGALEPEICKQGMHMYVETARGDIVGQDITLWAPNEDALQEKVESFGQAQLYQALRTSFHRIAMKSFAFDAVANINGMTLQDKREWQTLMGAYNTYTGMDEVMAKPEFSEAARAYLYEKIPAARPLTAPQAA